ncbi:hypothetical protein POM88_024443 [Heracleum sosnowskyi]|uniref:Nuclear pore complex protein GP210 C-terminal Ig-like domain-containing protein n=1 Tax=Heracleum sosnowskyi TaxID=360622 RepID=A0AAD8I3B5_9APIA|nr:hypothetical protein POM88_024443 [Heracleum sosnowskyi]
MFPIICYLILLLVNNAESRSAPGTDIDTDMLIRCKVLYVDNFARIRTLHSSVKGDSIKESISTRKDASVSVKAFLQGTNNTSSGSGPALFIGGFGILVIDHNSLQLNLTPNSNKSVMTIFGNTDIEVQVQGQDRLLITPISGNNSVLAGRAEYEIRVLSYEGFKDEVIISLNYETSTSVRSYYPLHILAAFVFTIEAAVFIRYRKRICNGNQDLVASTTA